MVAGCTSGSRVRHLEHLGQNGRSPGTQFCRTRNAESERHNHHSCFAAAAVILEVRHDGGYPLSFVSFKVNRCRHRSLKRCKQGKCQSLTTTKVEKYPTQVKVHDGATSNHLLQMKVLQGLHASPHPSSTPDSGMCRSPHAEHV